MKKKHGLSAMTPSTSESETEGLDDPNDQPRPFLIVVRISPERNCGVTLEEMI